MAGNMLFRDENGVVREVPSDQYISSKRAYPDLTWKGGGDDLSVGFLNDPAKTKALQLAKSSRIFPSSLFNSNPATAWTDADFARLMELQRPLSAPRTQREIDEEQYLKDKLAASTAAMQLKPDSYKSYQGDGKLTPARIAQMYPPTSDVEAQVAAAKRTPEYGQGVRDIAAAQAERKAEEARRANLAAEGAASAGLHPSSEERGAGIQQALEIINRRANEPPSGPLVDLQRSGIDRVEASEDEPQLDPNIVGPTALAEKMRAQAAAENAQKEAAGQMAMYAVTSPPLENAPLPLRRPTFTSAAPATGSATTTTSAARPAAPQPMRSPVSREEPSFLSRIFGGSQEPMTREQLWAAANADPENKGAYFRAAQADINPPAEKRGGAIKSAGSGGKDAALHKALEIIHHMLVRGR